MTYNIISGDGHVDLNWLPHDLFVDNAPSQWKDKMPHVEDSSSGPVWKANGKIMTPVGVFRAESWDKSRRFPQGAAAGRSRLLRGLPPRHLPPLPTPNSESRTRTWTASTLR